MTARSLRTLELAASLALPLALACAPTESTRDSDLASFAHERLAEGVHPTYVDFGGKLALVGFELSPDGVLAPDSQVHLTLYWKRTGAIEPGWGLFTHLEDERGRQLMNFDKDGPLRNVLAGKPEGVSSFELGKVYTDEQTFQMPKEAVSTPRETFVVGVWKGDMRLPVISGESDGHDSGIVTHISTGVPRRQAPRAPQG